jgi:hypothetical protein
LKFLGGICRLQRRNFKQAALGSRNMMNKSLRVRARESSRKRIYGFQHPLSKPTRTLRELKDRRVEKTQKRAAVSGGF